MPFDLDRMATRGGWPVEELCPTRLTRTTSVARNPEFTVRKSGTKPVGHVMRRRARIGCAVLLLLLLSGCGTSESSRDGTSTTPQSPSQSSGSRHVVEAHYFIAYGEGDDIDPKAGKAVVLTDGVRYRILVVGNGPEYAGFRQEFVFDGDRLFADDPDRSPQHVLYEAPHEHPDVLAFGSGLIFDPKMSPWNQVCGQAPPVPIAHQTIVGRSARNYGCPESTKSPDIWVDEATGLVLKWGSTKAHDLLVDPPITAKTFSTKTPTGTDVQVVPAK